MEVLFTYLDHGLLVLLNATGQPLLLQTNILTQFLRRFIGGGGGITSNASISL